MNKAERCEKNAAWPEKKHVERCAHKDTITSALKREAQTRVQRRPPENLRNLEGPELG